MTVDAVGGTDGTRPGPTGGVDHRHAVADYLRLERWEVPGSSEGEGPTAMSGRVPLDVHHRASDGGLAAGPLVTAIDSLGGFLCGLAVLPRWIVTTSVMATLARRSHAGPLRLDGRVLRRGRNAVVAGIEVRDEGAGDALVASATMTCAVLDADAIDIRVGRPFDRPMPPPDPAAPSVESFFGIRPGRGAVTRLELDDRLRNPWGILHGGGLAVLADVAACRAVADRTPPGPTGPVAATDMVLHFLRPTRVGPVEARCQVLGGGGGGGGAGGSGRALVRVAVHDLGADDRLVTLGSVVVTPSPS